MLQKCLICFVGGEMLYPKFGAWRTIYFNMEHFIEQMEPFMIVRLWANTISIPIKSQRIDKAQSLCIFPKVIDWFIDLAKINDFMSLV